MELKFEEKEDTLFLSIKGRVDTLTAPILEKSLQKEWTTKNLLIDLKDLEYVSSAGLRVFLAALKKAKSQNGALKLFNINDSVMEVFEITGFKKLFQL
ncbi:MAG: STAS domain-containing protein [Anaeroplasmataceae bacterium]|nr:STAS domain-containing protein [Anaeroplasmataceae bacterium]